MTAREGIVHYHLDHLGSTQVITNPDGSVFEYIRYKPYGEPRHYNPNGTPQTINTCGDDQYCHEFTGYESDPTSGLEYAGARFYDPNLGMFLTHDPARQFASPYTYTNWNPVNSTDPNGELVELIILAFVIGFLASFVQASANGAPAGQAFEAGAIGGAISGGTVVGLGVLDVAVGPALAPMLHAVELAGGAYSTVQGFRSGQYVAGSVGIVSLAFGAYGLYNDLNGAAQGTTPGSQVGDDAGGPPGPSPNQTLDLSPLPEGEGYYSHSPPQNQFGTPETIDVIQQAGKKGSELGLPEFGVGDISKEGGGPFSPHTSHQFGRDIDIWPLRTAGERGPVSVGQPLYSPDYTNQVIQIFRSDPRVGPIYFNDTRILGTTYYPGHYNHFHVRALP
jgi:RHS repeat-associated protein